MPLTKIASTTKTSKTLATGSTLTTVTHTTEAGEPITLRTLTGRIVNGATSKTTVDFNCEECGTHLHGEAPASAVTSASGIHGIACGACGHTHVDH